MDLIGMSGRKTQFLEIERELLTFFKGERIKGAIVTNQDLIQEGRNIASKPEVKFLRVSP